MIHAPGASFLLRGFNAYIQNNSGVKTDTGMGGIFGDLYLGPSSYEQLIRALCEFYYPESALVQILSWCTLAETFTRDWMEAASTGEHGGEVMAGRRGPGCYTAAVVPARTLGRTAR